MRIKQLMALTLACGATACGSPDDPQPYYPEPAADAAAEQGGEDAEVGVDAAMQCDDYTTQCGGICANGYTIVDTSNCIMGDRGQHAMRYTCHRCIPAV